jgi:hypothetical protein
VQDEFGQSRYDSRQEEISILISFASVIRSDRPSCRKTVVPHRRYVEALGGTLEVTARFPDGAVTIAEVGGTEARPSSRD